MTNTVTNEMKKVEDELKRTQTFEELDNLYAFYDSYHNLKDKLNGLRNIKAKIDNSLNNPDVLAALKFIVIPEYEKDPELKNSSLLREMKSILNENIRNLDTNLKIRIEKSPISEFKYYQNQLLQYLEILKNEREELVNKSDLDLIDKRKLKTLDKKIGNINNNLNNLSRSIREGNILDPEEQQEIMRTIKNSMKQGMTAKKGIEYKKMREKMGKQFVNDFLTGKDRAVEIAKHFFDIVPGLNDLLSGFFGGFFNGKRSNDSKLDHNLDNDTFGKNQKIDEKTLSELIEKNPDILKQYAAEQPQQHYSSDMFQ